MSRDVKIKEIAYGLWEQEGRPHGRDQEHYYQAEQLVDSKPAAKKVATSKPKSTTTRKTKAATTTRTRKPAAKKSSTAS
jgi:hypothetical protein